ncbi:rRNA methyltransferase mitochondrial [Chlorella sorokiniana]|uniref:rRNA methyltransferase mitochondrial n=1 Tax=Chlorella sorokiniana TaxID=3076 RepID=A0A2P6U567_CHLSO|nr:rRNA methyltransferase mitochondrial [Chlorella sorokiniana]|eukprot:PRW61461.1 rRNA methyltransferase mitochondrial [Chlorella sorokiniana]
MPQARSPARGLTVRCTAQSPQVIHISSTANQAVKHCVRLRESAKYRGETGSALICGRDLVQELAPLLAPMRALVALDGAALSDSVPSQRYVTVTPPVMQKLTGLGTCPPSMLAAEVALPQPADLLRTPRGQLTRVLALDGIQDAGNLGTLCRSALALGWQAVVLLPGCCDPFNDKAIKASRGAVFKLPLAQCSLEQWQQLVEAHGLLSLAAEPDRGSSSSSSDGNDWQAAAASQQQQAHAQEGLPGSLEGVQQRLADLPVCLCLGAEGQGLSPAVLQRCRPVSIPQAAGGQLMESLNVAAAGAILMFALSRGAAPLLAQLAAL